MAEAGYPDVTVQTFFGLSAPAGTPLPIAEKLNAAMRQIASQPDFEKRLLAMNVLPQPMGRAEMDLFIAQQSQKWGPVLKSLNINFD
jgi:tripartite-type tricarboxylate transporter receptor subunit TctC